MIVTEESGGQRRQNNIGGKKRLNGSEFNPNQDGTHSRGKFSYSKGQSGGQ